MPNDQLQRARPMIYGIGAVTIVAVANSAVLAIRGGAPAADAVLAAVGPALLLGIIGGASRFLCRAMPLRSTGVLRLLPAHAVSAIVAAGVFVAAWHGSATLLSIRGPLDTTWLFGLALLIYGVTVTVQYLALETDASRAAEAAALRYQVLAREAELKAFKAQVDPHFLFNSLNAVASLCGSNPQQAREMSQRLADFFRLMLRVGKLDRITLGEELELVCRYLAIEQVRFGPRLSIRKNVDEEAATCFVPPLLLQPLVENSIRHGIASMIDGGEVVIGASTADSRLHIWIENPADPDRAEERGEGIGLQNARGRLRAAFGPAASLRTAESGGSFRVDVEMPR